jgi:histidine triad (HIT) family protein
MSDSCLFCRIVQKEIPAGVVAESDDCLAIRDIDPKAPLHVLIMPKEHIASLNEAKSADLLGRLMQLAARIAREAGYAERGFRTVINTNADAGQTVFHLHVHVLAGRHMTWPPG